ncbi:MAG: PH domain-containing protein [Methanomassiliicoccales archaeon]
MICPRCGTQNEPYGKYCQKCGISISIDELSNTPAPATYIQKPPGYVAGAYPKEHLISGENILWEGKPALIAYIIGPIIFTFIGLLIAIGLPPLGLFLVFIGVIGIVVNYIRYTKTAFAITNRRVLSQYGVFTTKFADCPHDKIQNSVVLKPFFQTLLGYGDLMFATAGFTGGISSGSAYKTMANGGGVYWNGLPHPAEVKRFSEEVMYTAKNEAKKKEFEMMAGILNEGKKAEYQMMADSLGSNARPQNNLTIEDRLEKIKHMKEKGTITSQEYEDMRRKILEEV